MALAATRIGRCSYSSRAAQRPPIEMGGTAANKYCPASTFGQSGGGDSAGWARGSALPGGLLAWIAQMTNRETVEHAEGS